MRHWLFHLQAVCVDRDVIYDESFTADVMSETIDHTVLGSTAGDRVNLERAVQANGRLADMLFRAMLTALDTKARTVSQHWEVIRFSVDRHHARQIAMKGSITIDGVSLTIRAWADRHRY
jgi:riboflavin synthase alpha subunit